MSATVLLQSLAAVVVVSLVSFVGVSTLSYQTFFRRYLFLIVSFAAGTLLGAALLEMIPEALERGGESILAYFIVGFVTFFVLEKILYWYHCHDHSCEAHVESGLHKHVRVKEYAYLNLIGDGIHNFVDGAIIAVSFFASSELGIAATIAVVLHEIPQEIGDFAILVKAGFTTRKALVYNFLSAVAAVLGALVALFFVSVFEAVEPYLLAIGAGGFVYIATVDLLPEIHQGPRLTTALMQTLFFIVGILIIGLGITH